MYKNFLALVCGSILISTSISAYADVNEPFDFSYSIDGKNKRPVAVFNDGKNTFIQIAGAPKVSFNNIGLGEVSLRGPYYVVKGIPSSIEGISDGELFSIKWQGASNEALSIESDRSKADYLDKTFYGTYGRIAFINGIPADVGIVNQLPQNLQLKEVLKALAPHGWTGSADRSINVTQTVKLNSKIGESWVIVLDRLMQNLGVWVEIDSQKQNLYLRDAPPKGFSVVLDNKSQNRKVQDVTVGDLPRSNDYRPLEIETPLSNPSLSNANLARIGRSNGFLILTLIDSKKPMRFTDTNSGKLIDAKVINNGEAYQIPDHESLIVEVQNGEKIEIRLMRKQSASFDKVNALNLESVSQENGITNFKFAQKIDFQLQDENNKITVGNWTASTYSTSSRATEWKLINKHVAMHVQMQDKSFYAWRPNLLEITSKLLRKTTL